MRVKKPKLLIFSILICQLSGLVGSIATASAISDWYNFLNKPSFNPPNWIFGPVWLTLYTLMGIALYLVATKIHRNDKVKHSIGIFLLHLVVNSLWSIMFFGFKNIPLSFLVIILLWFMIAYLIKLFGRISRKASFLLYPYLVWVSFAVLLNYSIWRLN